MRRHTKLISPQMPRAKTTDLGLKNHSKLSGSRFFEEEIFGAEEEDDEFKGEDKDDADMEVAVAVGPRNLRNQTQGAKSKPKKKPVEARVAGPTASAIYPSDDEPVPEEGYFDGTGVKMWRKWLESGVPLQGWRKWRRDHDDEFKAEEEEERAKRVATNPETE